MKDLESSAVNQTPSVWKDGTIPIVDSVISVHGSLPIFVRVDFEVLIDNPDCSSKL